jgi:hypothetical protein
MSGKNNKTDKSDKSDAKADSKQAEAPTTTSLATGATTTTTPPAAPPARMSRVRRIKPARGLDLMNKNPEELQAAIEDAMTSLVDLTSDPQLPVEYQKLVAGLVSQASTEKPGMEEVTLGWKIPRITINQPTTTTAARPEAAKLGDLYTTEGKILEKPFPFLVFAMFQENVNFPQDSRIPACVAPDAQLGSPYGKCVECPHLPFGMQPAEEQKVTDCQNQIVAIVASVDMSKVYMVQFAKTSRSAGSALQSLAGAGSVPWANNYLLSTEKGSGQQAYFKYKVEPTGKPNNEHACKIAQALCNLYRAERDRALADHYRAATSAPAVAAAAEGAFQGGKLDAGLAGETESYELGDSAGSGAGSVRSAAKPM